MKKSRCDASGYLPLSLKEATNILSGKDIYIWGAGQKGRGFKQALERNGFCVENFIDKSSDLIGTSYQGLEVLDPVKVLQNNSKDKFIFTASVASKNNQMFKECARFGLKKKVDFDDIQSFSPFYPSIDITGLCNLKCLSCPRSREDETFGATGYMNFELYKKIIDKMVVDMPFLYLVDLYQWGEPILHPDISRIVEYNNKLGLASGLSTNLNSIRKLDEVLSKKPAQLRVSLSGASKETYDVTHTGGKWKRVERNMHTLGETVKKYDGFTLIEVYFHVYKDSVKEAIKIKKICEKYKFNFHTTIAMLLPEFALDYKEGKGLTPQAKKANDLMLIDIDKLIKEGKRDDEKNCLLTRCLPNVLWDGSVANCCNYAAPKPLYTSYLDVPFKEIELSRRESELCNNCQKHSLHRYFNPQHYDGFIKEKLDEVHVAG